MFCPSQCIHHEPVTAAGVNVELYHLVLKNCWLWLENIAKQNVMSYTGTNN